MSMCLYIYIYIYIHIYLSERVKEKDIAVSIEGVVQVDQRQLQFKSVNTMRFCPSYSMHGTVYHVTMMVAVVVA